MTITEPQTAGGDSENQTVPTEFDLLMDSVRAEFDTQFTWDYERGRDGLNTSLPTVSRTRRACRRVVPRAWWTLPPT